MCQYGGTFFHNELFLFIAFYLIFLIFQNSEHDEDANEIHLFACGCEEDVEIEFEHDFD